MIVGRLEILAGLVIAAGLALSVRGLFRLAAAIRARFTLGAPYHSGMIGDRMFALGLEIALLAFGAGLGFLALAQAGFQADESTARVGQVEARRDGWARVSVRMIPDPLYPAGRMLEGEISGARWAFVGDFITWEPGLKWIGLHDGHRVRDLIAAADTTGTTRADRIEHVPFDPPPAATRVLLKIARFLPFLTVRTETSDWFPVTDRQVMVLYAIGPGYLAETATVGTAPARQPHR